MKQLRPVLSILLGLLLLQGCSKNLIDTASTAVNAATPVNARNYKPAPNDSDLSITAIKTIIASDAYQKNMRINIVSNDGYVLLIGEIDNEENKTSIENSILALEGVKEIYNQLRVGDAISFYQQVQDSWTTIKVKSQLMQDDKVRSTKIKVVTENAEVFLIGNISAEMAYHAVSVARKVTGVKRVIKVFELTEEES